jgi:hypothetical protein
MLGLLLILISKSWGGGGVILHSYLLVPCVYVCILEVA